MSTADKRFSGETHLALPAGGRASLPAGEAAQAETQNVRRQWDGVAGVRCTGALRTSDSRKKGETDLGVATEPMS